MAADCFFCRFISGVESDWNRIDDIVLRTARTTAFVAPRWWPSNHGNAIVIPNEHVADLETANDDLLAELYSAVKHVARAMRHAYGCEGTSTRQHNGAAASQEVDHLHVHVFPRYAGDELYARDAEHRFATPEERAPYAMKLRAVLQQMSDT